VKTIPPPGLQIHLRPRVTSTFDLWVDKGDHSIAHGVPSGNKVGYSFSKCRVRNFRNRQKNRQVEKIMSPPVSMVRRRHKNGKYGRSFSVSGRLLWNSSPLTVRDVSLTLTQFCTRLKTFCFPEPTGHHHSASVTVSAVKFVCANTNLLTYLLTFMTCALDQWFTNSAHSPGTTCAATLDR